jgi:hypothetical protein
MAFWTVAVASPVSSMICRSDGISSSGPIFPLSMAALLAS